MKSLKELKKGNKFKINKYLFVLICFLILSVTVGYSALQQTLEISGKAAYRVSNIMRITGLALDSATNGGIEEYNSNYFKDSIKVGISLPSKDSTITYKVEISNLGNVRQWVDNISLSNDDNITFTVSELNIRRDLFYSGDSKSFYITFKYKDNANITDYTLKYDLTVKLNFVEPISYLGQRTKHTFEEIMNDEGSIMDTYFSDNSPFYGGPIKNKQINSISFTNNLFLEGYDGYFDMSDKNSGTVLGYYKKISDNLYDITVGGLDEVIAPSDSALMFAYLSNLTTLKFNQNFNSNNITNLAGLLLYDRSLTSVDINNLNIAGKYSTKNVTSTSYMFGVCTSLQSLNVSNLNTSNVTDMSLMFGGLTNVKNITFSDTSNNAFTTKNVRNMEGMFSTCIRLTELDLSTFDTSKVTNMNGMFSSFHTNTRILDITKFNTSNVTDMNGMFQDCYINVLKVGNEFNTSKVEDMSFMFENMNSIDEPSDINEYEYLKNLENDPINPNQIENLNEIVSHFTFDSLKTAYAMFRTRRTNAITISELNINKPAPNVYYGEDLLGINEMFEANITTLNLTGFEFPILQQNDIFRGGNINKLIWQNAKYYNLLSYSSVFRLPPNVETVDLSNMDITGLTSLNQSFSNNNSLKVLNLSGWDVSNITDFSYMFSGDSALEELDLSSFNVSTKVTYDRMFTGCESLKILKLNNWDFTLNDILEGVTAETVYANKKYQSYLEDKYPNQNFVFVS